MLLLTPLLLSWSFDLSRTSWNQWAEYALYYGILLPVSYLLFHGTTPYLFLIFVIYAVFRFPFVHVLLTMLSGDLIAIGMARFEHGAFTNSTLTGDLLSIQLFIIVTSVTGLFLYSVVRDRQNALEELSALNITLQEQIKEQTQRIRSSEEQYRLLVEHVPDIILVHQDGNSSM
jgi:integral membrane sensor domain MASE1